MANDLNQCNFIGRLGSDVESRVLQSGDSVITVSIALNWKGKNNEGTEWVRVVAFGKLAEIFAKYTSKGSRVFVSGSLRTKQWERDGVKRYTTEIIASNMQMLDSRDDQNSGAQSMNQAPQVNQQNNNNFDDCLDEPPF